MGMVKISTLTFEESWKGSPGRSDSSCLYPSLLNQCQSSRRDPQPVNLLRKTLQEEEPPEKIWVSNCSLTNLSFLCGTYVCLICKDNVGVGILIILQGKFQEKFQLFGYKTSITFSAFSSLWFFLSSAKDIFFFFPLRVHLLNAFLFDKMGYLKKMYALDFIAFLVIHQKVGQQSNLLTILFTLSCYSPGFAKASLSI